MIRTIGLVELNSIARGIETADFMLKAAEVNLLKANSICPGKYIVLVSGDVGAVKASVEVGLDIGNEYVVDSLILPSIHPQLISAINKTTDVYELRALGVLEFFSIATSIVAADTAAKSASVDLIELRLGFAIGGKSFITLTGDVSAVKEAVEAGARIGEKAGMLINKVVIPSPRGELLEELM
ncbi:Carboxysome shell and ethanolamine utilization microcompartment protein CcmL/EutN [Caminicella sporogenes DSM 14501]|uniref:Carboxysome shell and ethanolamine utilization microcompartment protein CcmL/EutN n=1 Tax=Caminicella sporogenes DSM 14501 TaxID=1121266 RepID=A0A1M6S1L2_9FIRM|nr:BMC domain-containing protein [Caminicella sporogenes]RKD27163.1 propanediol utilization protein [Caminicella sporogenes]WIF95528.1 BMC domain-containing protein [Caminicella sporogenes]SHK38519.1 Carboxysome shell and ethanolamine utilization microcompartment protein CcmL/EutN [Caminicella sporogenes DSM 14501]